MSFDNSPADKPARRARFDRVIAKAEAERAARLARRKSLFRRILGHLRTAHQEPASTLHSSEGTLDDLGRYYLSAGRSRGPQPHWRVAG
jgi:hypothetical protein